MAGQGGRSCDQCARSGCKPGLLCGQHGLHRVRQDIGQRARIMNALADPQLGMRCAFAIGLRTLTLQTGRSFQNDLGLSDEQLAIKVGGAASPRFV